MALLQRFERAQRGAVAVIFSLCIVPLVLLVALTVDYAFYVQARAQAALAADAAATHAVRAADAAYTYELAQNDPNAAADAAAAGSSIGKAWFAAQLGVMPRTSIPNPTVTVTQNTTGAAGFTATVDFGATYPPFFASLFDNSPWHVAGNAGATSAYDYVEIMMLLDNSPSMLIGADGPDIQTLETYSVCPPTGIDSAVTSNSWAGSFYQNAAPDAAGNTPAPPPPNLTTSEPSTGYQPASPKAMTGNVINRGSCLPNYQGAGNGNVDAPCAFACHTTTRTMTINGKTEYADLYGIARAYGATLRLDVLEQAAAQVINDMNANEQSPDQFSIGVYQFNDDIVPIYPAAGTGGVQPSEASTDLTDAASAITGAAPPLEANAGVGYTDFPNSVADFISGKYRNGTRYRAALAAGGTGTTVAAPQKDIFIVTDGMEDTSDPGYRNEGEMTSYTAENTLNPVALTPSICKALKSTYNATVYVLYIDYDPLSNSFYQATGVTASNYTKQDYPGISNGTSRQYAENTGLGAPVGAPSSPYASYPPNENGLVACASTVSDFFEASNSSEIGTALNAMLQSALTSTIAITQ
jgi:Flp pilus assembly protein TadG